MGVLRSDAVQAQEPASPLYHVTVVVVVTGIGGFLFWDVGDEALGGEQEAGDGGGVLKSAAGHLGWVYDASCDEFLCS